MTLSRTDLTRPRGEVRTAVDSTVRKEGTARLTLDTFATTVASNVALGAVSIVLARALGPSGKGAYDLVLATATLLATLFGLSLPTGVTYIVARGRATARHLVRRIAGVSVLQAALATGFLIAVRSSPVAPAFVPPGPNDSVGWAIFFFVALTAFQEVLRAVLIGRREIVRANRLDLLGRTAQLGLFIVVWLAAPFVGRELRAIHFVWLAVGTAAITCAFYFRAAYEDGGSEPERGSSLGELWRYALTSHVGNVAQFLNYRVAVFLIGFFLGAAAVGLYTIAMTLAQLHLLLAQASATVLLPMVASGMGEGDDGAVHAAAVTRAMVAITGVMALATAAVAGPLLPWIFGAEFEGSLLPLFLLLPGVVAFVPFIVLASYFGGRGMPHINLKGSVIGLAAIFGLSIVLVPRFGIAGAAIAASGACLVGSAVLVVAFSRSTRVPTWHVVVPRWGDLITVVRALRDRVGAGR